MFPSEKFFLKRDCISILDVKTKNINFHARYSAKLRTYEYLIINRQGDLSIDRDRAWHVKKSINLKLLKQGAKILEGTHDFSIFRASTCYAKSPIKKLLPIKVSKTNSKIKIRFSSKSFLQHQVRSMAGSLKYLSTGKWSLSDFKEAFKSKKRERCAPPAPACGLYLLSVNY